MNINTFCQNRLFVLIIKVKNGAELKSHEHFPRYLIVVAVFSRVKKCEKALKSWASRIQRDKGAVEVKHADKRNV